MSKPEDSPPPIPEAPKKAELSNSPRACAGVVEEIERLTGRRIREIEFRSTFVRPVPARIVFFTDRGS